MAQKWNVALSDWTKYNLWSIRYLFVDVWTNFEDAVEAVIVVVVAAAAASVVVVIVVVIIIKHSYKIMVTVMGL